MIKKCISKLMPIVAGSAALGIRVPFASTTFAEEKPRPKKDITIGLAVANLQADFFNQIKQSVEREAKAKGVKVITVDAKGDGATQSKPD